MAEYKETKRMSRKNSIQTFWSRVDQTDSDNCWVWLGYRHKGTYGRIKYQGSYWLAHRLAFQLTHGQFDYSMGVLHTCDNPQCVNPGHLYLGNPADNSRDKVSRNRQAQGETIYKSKLTELDVKHLRAVHQALNISCRDLGCLFEVASSGVNRILNNKMWKKEKA